MTYIKSYFHVLSSLIEANCQCKSKKLDSEIICFAFDFDFDFQQNVAFIFLDFFVVWL